MGASFGQLPRIFRFPNSLRDATCSQDGVLQRGCITPRSLSIAILIGSFVFGSFSTGCKPSGPSDQAANSSDVSMVSAAKSLKEMSPSEVVEYVHRHRMAGRWSKLEHCLLDQQRRDVIDLIQAVDKLEYANKVLSDALIHHFGRATAAKFGKPSAANLAGVFSTKLQIVSEKIQGEQAIVIIQVAGGVPLEKVPLVRCGSHWCIETDPPIKGLPKELKLLANALIEVSELLDVKSMSPEQASNTLQAHIAPMKRRITRMFEQATPQTN